MAYVHAGYYCILTSNPGLQILIFTTRLTVFCPVHGSVCPDGVEKMTMLPNNRIPLEAQYLYKQALDMSMDGKKEEALRYLKKVVFIAPRFSNAYNAMGNCLDELGRYEDAIRKYDKVLDIDPHHAEARFKRELVIRKILRSEGVKSNLGKRQFPEKELIDPEIPVSSDNTHKFEFPFSLMRIAFKG